MEDLAARWLKNVPALRQPALRLQFLLGDLRTQDTRLAAHALDEICLRSEQAEPAARDVLGALQPSFANNADDALWSALRDAATDDSLLALGRLLRRKRRPSAFPEAPPGPDARHPHSSARDGKVLTLGQRKALARGQDRHMLDRLLRDPHPHVIRNILVNPRITESDVVLLAARRPTYADIQLEIARHPRYNAQARVRLALVQNPYTPHQVAIPLLSLMNRTELRGVLEAMDLSAIVRAAAQELLDRRPPSPDPPEPVEQ